MLSPLRRLAGVGLVAAIMLAACSSTGGTSGSPAPGSASGNASSTPQAANSLTVATSTAPTLGTYLTGRDGKTLYTLTKDGPNKSTCTDQCATTWPPLVASAGAQISAGQGVTGTLATFARGDGSTQVTYNGMPLYYFSGDSKAGDTKGQGFGGVWFVAKASGTAPAPSSSSGGYSY